MPVLRWNTPQGAKVIELIKPTISIGRGTECDIVIEGDKLISRKHSELIRQPGGGYVVKDAGSKNGTFVNGSPIVSWVLKDSDVITAGETKFTFRHQK